SGAGRRIPQPHRPPRPPPTPHPSPHASLQYQNQTRHAGKYPTRPSPPLSPRVPVPRPRRGRTCHRHPGAARPTTVHRAAMPMPCHPPCRCVAPAHSISSLCLSGTLVPAPWRRVPALLSPSFSSFHLDHPPRHRHCRPAALEARASGARRPKPAFPLLLRWLPLAGTADGDYDRARRSLGVIYRLLPGLPLVSAAARR
ncbi:hypothetical protein PVAP13_3NG079604, partial [Panicum virgatum]